MKVIVHWSGGKDCCTALHKVVEQGHEVASLVTYIYMEPYVFHSLKVIEQQVKALGMPHQFVKITDNRYDDIMGTLERLHKEKGAQAIVTGDIDNVHHRRVWKDACKKLGVQAYDAALGPPTEPDSGQPTPQTNHGNGTDNRSESDSKLHRPKILHSRVAGTPN